MKPMKLILALIFLSTTNLFAQQNESNSAQVPAASAIQETVIAPPTLGKEVTILVKNSSEKSIAIFAGPREEIRNPKLNAYGGMSTNKVYVRENDAICLMTSDKKPIACVIVKPGVTIVEINAPANGIKAQ